MLKDQRFKTSGLQFDNWLFGPEKFSGLSRDRPLGPVVYDLSFYMAHRYLNPKQNIKQQLLLFSIEVASTVKVPVIYSFILGLAIDPIISYLTSVST